MSAKINYALIKDLLAISSHRVETYPQHHLFPGFPYVEFLYECCYFFIDSVKCWHLFSDVTSLVV